MATFTVPVVRIDAIENHPNADSLEIAKVGGFNCITRIGDYQAGDIAVYIPEGAVLPEWLLQRMNMWDDEKGKGKLAGKQGNRVKAAKLRGIVSQGLLYPINWGKSETERGYTVGLPSIDLSDTEGYLLYNHHTDVETIKSRCIDMDVAVHLGITKYEPPIPSHMNGEVCNVFGHTLKFDIENIQKHMGTFQDGEHVVITEKLHGTWTCFGFDPNLNHDELYHGGTIITSKGMSEQGLAFKWNENNNTNLYVQMFKELFASDVWTRYDWQCLMEIAIQDYGKPIYILGETFGPGVQDMHYGLKEKDFRVFAIYVGEPGQGEYLNHNSVCEICDRLGLDMVPVLYNGPFSMEIAESYRDGKESINGTHVREGIVIVPAEEREDMMVGRLCLKMVSPDYLLRKGNTTEYT